jgi:tRNA pseudouridine38-40 synthase
MRRVAVLLEYDGGGFVGWQRQAYGTSVQGVLEKAATRMAGGVVVACVAAGRTDSGVHATGQVAHMNVPVTLSLPTIRDALNFHMKPHAAAVIEVAEVADNWSARFSAIGRSYRYMVHTRRARLVLDRGRAWHVDHALDLGAMQEAAAMLVGHHDFTSFRASSCQAKSPVRTLDHLEVSRAGDVITITAAARSFLHHQVRNMVGSLKLVGAGKWSPQRVGDALEVRQRAAAGPTAPPDGLYLTGVRYPDDPFSSVPQ